jgi:hypothetical protein
MFRSTKRLWAPILAAAMCLPAGWAQGQQQQQGTQSQTTGPTTPVPPVTSGQQGQDQAPVSPIVAPASEPVTGAYAPTVEAAGETRSMFQFGLHASATADSDALGLSNGAGWDYITDFGGHLDLQRIRKTSELTLSYIGGGIVYDKQSEYDGFYQGLTVSDQIEFRNWTLHLTDQFSYLPESAFGFDTGGLAGVGGALGGFNLLNPNVAPDQSILSLQSQRISNSAVAQASINTSARSVWTLNGDYGILHYMQAGYLQPSNYNAGVGYNYTLSRRSTIGVSYQLTLYRFNPSISSINDHVVLLTYGRSITGRLAFHAGAGPEFDTFSSPGGPQPSRLQWSANVGLTYQYNQTAFQASGYRGTSGGAGVFVGAETSGAQIGASRPAGRRWSLAGSVGYSISQTLSQTSDLVGLTGSGGSYQAWYVSASAARNIGRTNQVFVRYNLQRQTTGGTVCGTGICLEPFYRHQVSVGINWDMRPKAID